MAKKTKQPTFKEQVYQSIANSHVQQAVQNNGVAQLQAEYDAWKNQNGVQALQAEYDNWAKSQPKAQATTSTQKKTSEKKYDQVKFMTADERKAYKERITAKKPGNYDESKSYANTYGKMREKDNTIGSGLTQIPKRKDYIQQFEEKENKTEDIKKTTKNIQPYNPRNYGNFLNGYTEQSLNPVENTPTKNTSAKENENFNDLADRLLASYNKRGAMPFTYQAQHWENPYESLSDSEKELVRGFIQENKDNPNLSKEDRKILRAFTTIYTDAGNRDLDTSNVYTNSMSDAMRNINSLTGGFVGYNMPVTKALAHGVAEAGLIPGLNEELGGTEGIDNLFNDPNSDANKLLKKAESDNPFLNEIGKGAAQIYDYLISSPFINSIAGSLGLTGNAAKVANQVAQGGQDLAIDIYPEAQRMLREEGKIDWGELIKRFGVDVVQNAAMDIIPSLAGSDTLYNHLAKTVGNDADIFKTMDASGALKNAPDVLRETYDTSKAINAQNDNLESFLASNNKQRTDALNELERLARQNESVIGNVNEVTDSTNKQFSSLMADYNNEFKDNSAMKNIFTPEDLEAAQNEQFTALMKQRPQELPKTELPLADNLKPIGESPSLTGNNTRPATFGFTPLQEEIESDLKVIAEPMNKLSASGYMDNITDANAIKKWNDLNDAYGDYVMKATFGGTYDEINNARKKMESTRKAFARAMEEIDPEVARSFNTSSYGKAVGRPAYKALGTELTPEQIEKNYRAILEAEGYEPEQIEAMIKEADIRGSMNAATGVDNTIESAAKTQQIDNIAENTTDNSMNMDLQHFGGDNPSEPNWKVSQAYTNTGKNGGGWTEAEYNKYTDPKHYVYESIDEEQSVKSAIDMRAKEGREAFKKRVMSSERISSVELDGLMMEWRETVEEARALEAAGKAKEADKLWWESNKIFRTVQEQSTDNAQALQALAKWSRNTPEGMLANAENIINGKVKPQESELKKALDKWARRRKVKVEFSPEFEKEFLDEAEKIDGLHGAELDTPEAKEVMAKLGKMVNEQIPVKLSEKLQTYLMDSMLGNFRTLISRNAGGNIGLNAIEQFTQRPLAAGIDSLVAKKTGVRTQAGLSFKGLADYFEGFKKGLADELSDVKSGLHTARSGENTLENAISSNRRIFKSKLMNLNDQLVRHGLSVGDRPFYESVYKQTLGDYQRLYDRGLMGDVVQSLKPDEFKAYAETAAHLNALSAVYQQDSMFSKGLMELKKGIGQLSQGAFGVDILSQFSMPFVKTPANVIERAIDYSPLGMIRNSLRTGAEVKAGAFDQNRFVNETARNILGTAGMGAGVGLAKNGTFSGSYSDDKDVKQAQKERGEQEYAWNVPEQAPFIGGKQMDISWIPVLGSNMVASAAAYDAYKNGEGDRVGNIATGLEKGGEALFDQSMFQGLQRLFGTGNSYDSDKGIVGNAGETIKSGLGQAIPSLARQTAQVLDPYQRDISNSNKDVSFGPMDNYNINSLVNNLPKVREKYLAPKVDTQGNLMMENQGRNVGSKILEDMILPGKLTEIKSDALNDEAQRLAEANHSNKAFIPKADRKVVDQEASEENEGHIHTNEEWVDYQQKYYKALNDAGLKLIDSDYYKGLDDAEKEAILDNTYKAIRIAVNSEYSGKEVSGASKAYIEAGGGEEGSKAVINYYTAKNYVDKAGTTMSSKAGESIKAAIGRNDYEAAEKIANKNATYKAAFEKYDMDNTETNRKMFDQYGEKGLKQLGSFEGYGDNQKKAFNIYQNAKSVIPGLSVSQFKTQYDKIDGSGDKGKDDGSITQGEMISFLNEGNYSEAEATKYWNAYGNAWKATLYKTKKGKWAYKTK